MKAVAANLLLKLRKCSINWTPAMNSRLRCQRATCSDALQSNPLATFDGLDKFFVLHGQRKPVLLDMGTICNPLLPGHDGFRTLPFQRPALSEFELLCVVAITPLLINEP
jgi:hypothetical protein